MILTGTAILGGLLALAIGVYLYVMLNVEQPKYALVAKDDDKEIRDYPALVVAEVTRRGDRNASVRAGFSPLAGYIFAKNRGGESVSMTAPVTQTREKTPPEKIAMTAPVTQTPAGGSDDQTWRIRFIMPSKYTLETLPKPAGEDVRLLQEPAARRAAIRFAGVASDALIATKETELRAWLAAKSIAIIGAPTFAYYNDPLTPGPLRRNEVLFEVQRP